MRPLLANVLMIIGVMKSKLTSRSVASRKSSHFLVQDLNDYTDINRCNKYRKKKTQKRLKLRLFLGYLFLKLDLFLQDTVLSKTLVYDPLLPYPPWSYRSIIGCMDEPCANTNGPWPALCRNASRRGW